MSDRYHALLIAAAQAVVDRWDTPLWKDVEPTAHVIGRLRSVLNAIAALSAAPGGSALGVPAQAEGEGSRADLNPPSPEASQ